MSNAARVLLMLTSFVLPPALSSAAEQATKRALLIGIDQYEHVSDLRGAVNDVESLRSLLIGKFAFEARNIDVLLNGAATRTGIFDAFARLGERTAPGDIVVIHFSGHGSQVIDESGDEIDGFDETILPVDARGPDAVTAISDDELEKMLEQISAKTPKLTGIVDACFKAPPVRGGAGIRCVAADERIGREKQNYFAKSAEEWEALRRDSDYALLMASGRSGVANETLYGSGNHGVFTYELLGTLIEAPPGATFGTIAKQVNDRVQLRFPTQSPSFSLPSDTAPVFFVADAAPARNILAMRSGPSPERSMPTAVAARAEQVAAMPRSLLTVRIDEHAAGADSTELRTALSGNDRIRLVDRESDAQMQVTSLDDGFAIVSGDLTILEGGLRNAGAVASAIDEWVRYFTILELRNPASNLLIDLRVSKQNGEDAPSGRLRPGDIIRYEIRNLSSQALHVRGIVMSSDGSVEELRDLSDRLPVGGAKNGQLGTFLPTDRHTVTDTIKIFATTKSFTLDDLLEDRKGPYRFQRGDWVTDQSSHTLARENARVSAFAVHVDDIGRSTPDRFDQYARTVCDEGRRGCVYGRSLTADGSIVVIDRTLRRSNLNDVRPPEAFQEGYELRRQLNVERVEPLFEAAFGDDYSDFYERSSSRDKHDPAAEADKRWSSKYIRAPEAWEHLQGLRGVTHGQEASGVRIAHLDTGYREHPEIWGDGNVVLPKLGKDFVDGDDPYDTLSTQGLLPNPGHGTASGSVIVSQLDCQLPDTEKNKPCITGIGVGAQLIPIRVHTSVVVFNQQHMAAAILDVAEGRIDGHPRIISIAMGGPPSWSLWKAVQKAEDKGVLIIAAAGNRVRTVVWPARFGATIAVGAINVRCKPWSGTSRGRRVDISAPGESVWRAQIDREDGDRDIIGMSSGTTFATANATGAAALWVARHMDSQEFLDLVSTGGVTAAFRQAARSKAWRPVAGQNGKPATYCENDVGWDSRGYGAGILDARALLDVPLAAPAGRAATSRSLDDLPLFASLYPEGTALDQIRTDYSAIFPRPNDDIRYLEAEIMYQYSISNIVGESIDAIVEGARGRADYERARDALLVSDISRALKEALTTP